MIIPTNFDQTRIYSVWYEERSKIEYRIEQEMCLFYATFTERLSSQCDAFGNLNPPTTKRNRTKRAPKSTFEHLPEKHIHTHMVRRFVDGLSDVNVVGHASWIKPMK